LIKQLTIVRPKKTIVKLQILEFVKLSTFSLQCIVCYYIHNRQDQKNILGYIFGLKLADFNISCIFY